MIQKSKLFPTMVVFALFTSLTACSSLRSSSASQIDVVENAGAATGLPEVEMRVEDLTASHRQIRDRFGALETLYIDLRKSTSEQSSMVGEVKRLMTENKSLQRELLAMKTRQQKTETLADRLIDRVKALETGKGQAKKTSMAPTMRESSEGTEGVSDSSLVEPSSEKPQYAVHLASFRDTAQINTGWSSLQEKFPHVLGGLTARIETSTLPQLGSFLRLLAGPFVSLSEAKTLCDSLQLKNQYCKPAPFMGENIE